MAGNVPGKDYWGTRSAHAQDQTNHIAALKKSRIVRPILRTLASLRVGNEIFVSEALDKLGAKTVLEVACGPGQDLIPIGRYAIGVDLLGSPRNSALGRGYSEYLFYSPDGEFEIERDVDAVVCINLNAHVSPDLFQRILGQGLRHLRSDGVVILVNEYDNVGLTYRWMKRHNRQSWDEMVRRMDHGYLEHETKFLERLPSLGLREVERQVLTAGVQPASHYLWWLGRYGAGSRLRRAICLLADVPLSIINSVIAPFSGRDRAFLVGHILKKDAPSS